MDLLEEFTTQSPWEIKNNVRIARGTSIVLPWDISLLPASKFDGLRRAVTENYGVNM